MALDGLVVSNVVYELNDKLVGGRISKIAQPEKDELLLSIKNNRREQLRLLISAGAGLPLIYLTAENKLSPMTAPNFCMLLRKHLNSAKILEIKQVDLERVIQIKIEHLNELGDSCHKYLIIELMGKHSNIIFCDENYTIIDSIKRISGFVSSVREVLPGREYFIPNTMDKINPFTLTKELFFEQVLTKPMPLHKAIYTSLTGFSPLLAQEICYRSSLEAERSVEDLSDQEKDLLFLHLASILEQMKTHDFNPNIVFDKNEPIEFSCLPLALYANHRVQVYDSISDVLEQFYAMKNTISRIRQKSVDLRRVVNTVLERNRKKLDLQQKQWKDTEKRDKFKVYGELINTYGYDVEKGAKSLTCLNYYTNEDITIPLDTMLTPLENSKRYFEKYNKLKRTYEALTKYIEETSKEVNHLESIGNSLDIALYEEDLAAIKEELIQCGHIRRKFTKQRLDKRAMAKSKPFHYISSDGFDIYVGKNNFQNDELTFNTASDKDWWFHAKGMAGSHVVVKTNGKELPDRTFEEAGRLAGYYSKARGNDKAEIDYTEKKNVKKPKGSNPGFVVYYTNYSLLIPADITGIQEINDAIQKGRE